VKTVVRDQIIEAQGQKAVQGQLVKTEVHVLTTEALDQ
jgi:hypothetical protein